MGRRWRRRSQPAVRRGRLEARRPSEPRQHILAAAGIELRAVHLEREAVRLRVQGREARHRLRRRGSRPDRGRQDAEGRLSCRRAGPHAFRRTYSARRVLLSSAMEQLDRDFPAWHGPEGGGRLHRRAREERFPVRRLHDGRRLDVPPGVVRVLREGLPRPEGALRPYSTRRAGRRSSGRRISSHPTAASTRSSATTRS